MKVPLFKIFTNSQDVKAVSKIIKRAKYWATGPEIQEFERQISKYIGCKYVVSFNSGTSSLHAMLLAFNIREGDEIIVPSFSFIATANAVLFVGATPVFADIEKKTYGLDIKDVKRKITRKTKAIILMHYGGCPAFYTQELKLLAKNKGLLFFEDAAQSFGAAISKTKVGNIGDAGVYSFCQNKIITTGEGGVVVTDSHSIYRKLLLIRSHGRLEKENYFYSTKRAKYIALGYNFRMPSISAALGISQLKRVNKIIKMRKSIAHEYRSGLDDINSIKIQLVPEDFLAVYQLFTILVQEKKRDILKKYLIRRNIQAKVYFNPIHQTSFYKKQFGYKRGYLPITESISRRAITIPLYPTISKKQRKYIISQIVTFFNDE